MAEETGRGLDHVVHAVRDLDVAADLYRRLGFTVGARNRHSWGTHNHVVQFPGFFIELLTLAEPEKLGSDGFSVLFGAYNRDFTARHEGLSLLVLESDNAAAAETTFRAAGIAGSETMAFAREGKRPNGSAVKVGFSLAFAEDKRAPDIHFAVCQQHYPENFWNPAFQQHANRARGIAGVIVVAKAPELHRGFFEAFAGASATPVTGGFAIATPRGMIEVLTPDTFSKRFGVAPPEASRSARLAALRFADAAKAAVVGPDNALGAVLVFETAR